MELLEALRTTGAVRSFRPDPVSADVVARILDTARFAPSGGNQQAWHVVVVEDADKRRRLRDLYLTGWYEYLAMSAAGLRPWAPLNDRAAEAAALATLPADPGLQGGAEAAFPETLDRAPALLVVFVDLRQLAAVDRDLGRYTMAGGASVYPFAWSILLAARDEGLAGVLTTMAIRREPDVQALFGAHPEQAVAAVIALGHPVHQPRRLTRSPVEAFATVDAVDGPPVQLGPAPGGLSVA